ncbi:MAG: hypothetical protein M1820_009082 [Bogoriella megaspora]|nr:MAG: hypothetical protein M1820_009082 [Bogoriella megaspora]
METTDGSMTYDEWRRIRDDCSPRAPPEPSPSPEPEQAQCPPYFMTYGEPMAYHGYPQTYYPDPAPPKSPKKDDDKAHTYYYIPPAKPAKSPESTAKPQTYYYIPSSNRPKSPETRPPEKHYYYTTPPPAYVPAVNHPESKSHVWFGRTKEQVDEDNRIIAQREDVYKPMPIQPKGAKPDQQFWVVEADGKTTTMRTYYAIENHLGDGEWKIDPRHGNMYFVRKKKD